MDAISSALLVGAVFGGVVFIIGQVSLCIRKARAESRKRQLLERRKLPKWPEPQIQAVRESLH